MSSVTRLAGESIRRGAETAIHELNQAGGVRGRLLHLVVKDHRCIPARGIDNLLELAELPNLVAVIGGVHTPVAMAELPTIHEHGIIYLGPWAAGTGVVQNDYHPNCVFRVSVCDEYAGEYLVRHATERGFRRLGLLLELTAWGRSNDRALRRAADQLGADIGATEWFNWAVDDLTTSLELMINAGCDAIIFVGNVPEGMTAVRSMAGIPLARRLPIVSHWGITAGDFYGDAAHEFAAIDLTFLQTFSFHEPPFPDRARRFREAYAERFPAGPDYSSAPAAVGMAHSYDLVRLLAKAIDLAGSWERGSVRDALERLPTFPGLIRDYAPAFTPQRHDALDIGDLQMAFFGAEGCVMPFRTDQTTSRQH